MNYCGNERTSRVWVVLSDQLKYLSLLFCATNDYCGSAVESPADVQHAGLGGIFGDHACVALGCCLLHSPKPKALEPRMSPKSMVRLGVQACDSSFGG